MISKLCCFALLFPLLAQASSPVAPVSLQVQQPDGYTFTAYPKGYHDQQWLETQQGYTIVKRGDTWYYAEQDDSGDLIAGHIRVASTVHQSSAFTPNGSTQPSLSKHLKPSINKTSSDSYSAPSHTELHSSFESRVLLQGGIKPGHGHGHSIQSSASTGTQAVQPMLVLMLSFSDSPFLYSESSFNDLVFGDDKSISRFYSDASFGKLKIQPAAESSGIHNDGVLAIHIQGSHPNFGSTYGDQSQNLVKAALNSSDTYVNYKQFDKNGDGHISPQELALIFIVAGYENAYGGILSSEPKVWAHKASIDNHEVNGVSFSSYAMFGERHGDHQATIGIMCHEVGHLLYELPDLYDRTQQSNGVGRWGLMGNGSWNTSGAQAGDSPADFLAWSKLHVGFSVASDLSSSTNITISPSTQDDSIHRVWLDPYKRREHFLLENRQAQGFDRGLPGTGLLISHVDPDVGIGPIGTQNDNASHKLIDIEEADGFTSLDDGSSNGDSGDTFPGSQNKMSFDAGTSPSVLSYEGYGAHVQFHGINQSGLNINLGFSPGEVIHAGNIGFDERGPTASWGYGTNFIETAIEFTNHTDFNRIDGVDVHVDSAGDIDLTVYEQMVSGQLIMPLYSQNASVNKGWNRIIFTSPLAFDGGNHVYLSLKVQSHDHGYPVSIDAHGVREGQAFARADEQAFTPLPYDLSQRLLLSHSNDPINLSDLQDLELLEASKNKQTTDNMSRNISDTAANNTDSKESTTVEASRSSSNSGGGALGAEFLLSIMLLLIWRRSGLELLK